MFEIFYKYLILNKKVNVPGIGVFAIERKPAKLDFANKIFNPPAFKVNFKPQPSLNDNRIYSFIANEQRIDEPEAVSRYYNFSHNLKEDLSKHKSVNLLGMGVLSQNEEGQVFFNATTQLQDYFPAVASERVLRENTEHHILVGDVNRTNTQMKEMLVADEPSYPSQTRDYWWLFAIALGIIGVATIVYYYLHNGSLH